MNIGSLLNLATKMLKSKEIDTARLDSQLILGNVLSKDKIYLMINSSEEVEKEKEEEFLNLINKRMENMPVRYILGEVDFMGLDFYIEEGVLIPRSDTEVLVEEVLKIIEEDEKLYVCDYRKNIMVDLIDFYEKPEKISKKNIIKNNLENQVKFIKSDLLKEPIKELKKYDIIVSNPPYIKEDVIETLMDDVKNYEPRSALSGGDSGLIFYERIVEESKKVLKENGILAFEIGYDQGDSVSNIMKNNGYIDIKVVKDLAGLDRVVIGRFSP